MDDVVPVTSKERTLVKTLTCPVGKPLGYDNRKKKFVSLTDEQRQKVYKCIREIAKCYAQVVNIISARLYSTSILGVKWKEVQAFTPNYKPILDRLGWETAMSGQIKSQTYQEAKSYFSGDHGKDLMARGIRQLPTARTDGTHPVPIRGDGVKLHEHEDSVYITLNMFAAKWAKEEEIPSWIAFPFSPKPRDKTMIGQIGKVFQGEWVMKNARIMRNPRQHGARWLCQLVVSYQPDPFKTLRPQIFMGIDLGVNVPAALHIRENGTRTASGRCG